MQKLLSILMITFLLVANTGPVFGAGGGKKKGAVKSKAVKITQVEKTEKEVIVYPNPTKGKINIVFTNALDAPPAFTVFNIIGKDLKNIEVTKISANQYELNLSDKDAGLYFIRIHTNEFTITERITLDFKVSYTIS